MAILVTGGAGYIGSHTCVEMINSGYEVIVVDNFDNSCAESLKRVQKITGKRVKLYEADVRDEKALRKIFKKNKIEAVIHFAGLKAVGESVRKPIEYYDNNLISTLRLLEVMREFDCKKLVFSRKHSCYQQRLRYPIQDRCPIKSSANQV
jgi:UDP-glucose 4-epimerase